VGREEPRRRRRVVALLTAVAAVIVIGVGGVVWQQGRDERSPDQFSQIAAADDAQSFTVPVGDGGSATVVVSQHENKAYIETKGMPAAPSGHQYVLWLQHDDVMVPAGVMPAGADNKVLLSGDAASANGAGVTVETAGEEPTKPSDDVVALFSFDT
ncbi:MAG TPA: anti-sigma factor, partial [Nocardioides sp.]|nr:anti-sigma factor [Nocardioides sp.]